MSFKIRIPKVVAVEIVDGLASRLEYDCGCVTVRTGNWKAGVVWSYRERCAKHAENVGATFGGSVVLDPGGMPEWFRR